MLNALFNTLLPLFGIVKPELVSIDKMYAIPVPKPLRANKPASDAKQGDSIIETETSIFSDNEKTKIRSGTFDFATGKTGKVPGSVTYLTTYDEQCLSEYSQLPKNTKLRGAIADQKQMWSNGEPLEQICQRTGYGISTVQKRCAAFSRALDMEEAYQKALQKVA